MLIARLLVLSVPAVLLIMGWRNGRHVAAADVQEWRTVSTRVSLALSIVAWILLVALELPMAYYGREFAVSFWRHAFPIGAVLALVAIPLAAVGLGRARPFFILAAISLFAWWWFLGLLE